MGMVYTVQHIYFHITLGFICNKLSSFYLSTIELYMGNESLILLDLE